MLEVPAIIVFGSNISCGVLAENSGERSGMEVLCE